MNYYNNHLFIFYDNFACHFYNAWYIHKIAKICASIIMYSEVHMHPLKEKHTHKEQA